MESGFNLQEALKTAGMNEKEAKTYLDLRTYGQSMTGPMCRRTGIPSSQIYTLLDGLIEKGLVAFKLVNNRKVFSATDPESLKLLFDEREDKLRKEKEKLLKAISEMKVAPSSVLRLSDFKYFHGIRGIRSLYAEIIDSWKEGDEYYIASAPLESFKRLEGFFMEVVHKKRVRDKVRLKMIINKNAKRWGLTRVAMPLTEVRYLDIVTETEYGVLKDYFFLITYGAEPYGLLIKDPSFASTFMTFFCLLWQRAAPLR